MSEWFRRFGFADVYDGLLVGAIPLDTEDVRMLDWIGVGRILNLVDDAEYVDGSRPIVQMALHDAGIDEYRVPVADYGSLSDAALEEATAVVNQWLDERKIVYVHCRAGWQRSAAVAAGALAVREGLDVDSALQIIRSRRPTASPLPHQRADLRRWWSSREGAGSVRGAQVPLAE